MLPNKILIIQNSLKTTFLFRRKYIEKLIKDGIEVYVFSINDCEDAKEKLINMGVNVITYNIYSKSFFKKIMMILYSNILLLKNIRMMDKICCHFLISFLQFIPVLLFFSRKTIISVEGLGSFVGNNKLLQKILKFIFYIFKFKVIFCNSDEQNTLGNNRSFVFGPIGVDTVFFTKKTELIKTEKNKYRLLYVGRLLSDKGFWDLIFVMRFIKSMNTKKQVHLEIVGDIYPSNPTSITQDDITKIKDEFGDSIQFTPFTSNIKAVYERSDILLLPSRREGFPVCVMEASSMGIPSIVYNVPGSKDAIINNINGIIVEQNNILSFSQSVISIMDREKLIKFDKSCKELALTKFDIEEISKNFINDIIYKY